MQAISTHITYADSIKSDTATRLKITNAPTKEHLANMKLTGKVFDLIVERLKGKVKLRVNSMYRSRQLNDKIPGSSNTSQHSLGQAVDMDVVSGSMNNWQLFLWIQTQKDLVFDQLIYEKSGGSEWVHISYSSTCNRRQVMTYDGRKYSVYNGQNGQSCNPAMVALRGAQETAWAYINKAKALKKHKTKVAVGVILVLALLIGLYYLHRQGRLKGLLSRIKQTV